MNFWFALYIPTALDKISWGLYLIFAGISFLAALSTWLFQPETANRSLEEMDAMFEGKTMWIFKDKDLCKVHPNRDALFNERFADDATQDEKKPGTEMLEKV